MNRTSAITLTVAIMTWIPIQLPAQVLPPHPPLRVLIVSDEVNPHGLPPEQLTQPGELTGALLSTSALNLDNGSEAVIEINTDQIEDATSRLLRSSDDPTAYDVLIYFAHRIPSGGDGATRQAAFVSAVDSFLQTGAGVVSFHHGIYRTSGKQAMQSLLGGEATGAVPWDTVDGQDVIDVSGGHFITNYGVSYPGTTTFSDPGLGITNDNYPFFNNTPDERYPTLAPLPDAGDIQVLLSSFYDSAPRLLAYLHRRPQWPGVVAVYQPGEYQPNALEPGNNLQILLNAIVFVGTAADGEILFGDTFEADGLGLWSATVGP